MISTPYSQQESRVKSADYNSQVPSNHPRHNLLISMALKDGIRWELQYACVINKELCVKLERIRKFGCDCEAIKSLSYF